VSPDKLLAIAFSFVILGQAWLLGARAGTWLLPACVFGFFWFLYTFIPLAAMPTVPANPWAVGYIAICAVAFSLASAGYDWRAATLRRASSPISFKFDTRFMRLVFWGCIGLTLLSIFVNWSIQGLTLNDLVFNLLETAGSYVDRKYRGLLIPNVFATLSVVLVYPGVIIGGLIFGDRYESGSRKRIILFALLPAVLVMLAEGNKGSLPLVLVLFWASVLLSRVNRGQLELFGSGVLRQATMLGLFFLPIVVIAFLARGLSNLDDLELITDLLQTMFASYMFGHLYAFADWFSAYTNAQSVLAYDPMPLTGGFYTFMPIYELFAVGKEVPSGIYSEYFDYQMKLETNIYTIFRGLILDFGLVGGVVVLMLISRVAHWAFFQIASRPWSPLGSSLYVHSIGFCYSSFVISFLIWDSVYASVMLVAMVLLLNGLIQKADAASR
jgi:oligosaccharide repeat unit polymerase